MKVSFLSTTIMTPYGRIQLNGAPTYPAKMDTPTAIRNPDKSRFNTSKNGFMAIVKIIILIGHPCFEKEKRVWM
jgi:hypothetical protein